MTNSMTRIYDVYIIGNYLFKVYFLGLACLPWLCNLGGVVNYKYFCPMAYAWDTGGGVVFACNLDIFFGKLVTCTHYGATYWDNL